MNNNMIKLNGEVSISPTPFRVIKGGDYLNGKGNLLDRKVNDVMIKLNDEISISPTLFKAIKCDSHLNIEESLLKRKESAQPEVTVGSQGFQELKGRVRKELDEDAKKSERPFKKTNFGISAQKDLETMEAVSEWPSLEGEGNSTFSDEAAVEWFLLEAIGGSVSINAATEEKSIVEEQLMYFFP